MSAAYKLEHYGKTAGRLLKMVLQQLVKSAWTSIQRMLTWCFNVFIFELQSFACPKILISITGENTASK